MKKSRALILAVSVSTAIGINFFVFPTVHAAVNPKDHQRVMAYVGGDIHTLTFTNDGLFVTGHQGGSYSPNDGLKWIAVPSFKNTDIMGWATTNLGYLAGGHTGLYRSTGSGKPFVRFNFYGTTSDVHSIGAAGKNAYIGSPEVGFLRSSDSGKTWILVNAKFGQEFMGSMLVDPKNPLRVIAPDMSNGLVVTIDGGKTWKRFGGPDGVMSVAWNPKNYQEIVALGMGMGAITKNDGKTWTSFPVPTGSAVIARAPTGSRIYVAVLVGDKAKVLSSDNLGKSWQS